MLKKTTVLCTALGVIKSLTRANKRSAKGSNVKADNGALHRLGVIKSLTRANKRSAKGSNVKEDNNALPPRLGVINL